MSAYNSKTVKAVRSTHLTKRGYPPALSTRSSNPRNPLYQNYSPLPPLTGHYAFCSRSRYHMHVKTLNEDRSPVSVSTMPVIVTVRFPCHSSAAMAKRTKRRRLAFAQWMTLGPSLRNVCNQTDAATAADSLVTKFKDET